MPGFALLALVDTLIAIYFGLLSLALLATVCYLSLVIPLSLMGCANRPNWDRIAQKLGSLFTAPANFAVYAGLLAYKTLRSWVGL